MGNNQLTSKEINKILIELDDSMWINGTIIFGYKHLTNNLEEDEIIRTLNRKNWKIVFDNETYYPCEIKGDFNNIIKFVSDDCGT